MKVASLIVEAARRAVEDDPGLLGVRLSPVALGPEEAARLVPEARKRLGAEWYVVASAPGVLVSQAERSYIAPDKRSAEQATAWRNTVRVGAGEHLLYVSAEEHEKASGLRDCLFELTDETLARAFLQWCASPESGMPRGLHEALEEAGIAQRVSPSALCAFAEAVREGAVKRNAWEAVGQVLPVLGLARDTALRSGSAAERLDANQRLVGRAAASEVRRAAAVGPLAAIERELRTGIARATAAERDRALSSVDLGSVPTVQLRGVRPKPRQGSKVPARVGKGAGARKRRLTETPSGKVDAPSSATADAPILPGPSTSSRRRLLPAAPELPAGLATIIAEILRSEGQSVVFALRGAGRGTARRWLTALPSNATLIPSSIPTAVPAAAFETWVARRREFIAAVSSDVDIESAARYLVRAPQLLLAAPSVRAAAASLCDAAAVLYRLAQTLPDETVHDILNFETATLRDEDGPVLHLLGPLHPLLLGQALEVAIALSHAGPEEETARRLLIHALRAPAAPTQWPGWRGSELLVSRPELGLIVFEREPEAVSPSTLQAFGERLLTQYLALCPYARLGVRVVVLGEASDLLEGFARAVLGAEATGHLEVATPRPIVLRTAGDELVAQRRLFLRGVPSTVSELRPHLLIRLAPPIDRPEDEEPPDSMALEPSRAGLLRTSFDVGERGLRARTAVAGIPVLQAFEALHAAARGRQPRGEFLMEAHAVSLAAALASGATSSTWQVVVGARLGRRPPAELHLLAFEALEGVNCAVVARDVRAAGRAVAGGLRRLGIQEERTRALNTLASHLAAAHAGGLLSLEHAHDQRIAAGVLALQLRRQRVGFPIVVVPIDGAPYEALVGSPAATDAAGALLFGVSVEDGTLAVTAGYATLDSEADVTVSRGHLGGAVGQRIARLLDVLGLAGKELGLGSAAARQILAWLLWPAVAADGPRAGTLVAALRSWERGSGMSVSVTCLLPPGLLRRAHGSVRVGEHPATVLSLDVDLFNRLIMTR